MRAGLLAHGCIQHDVRVLRERGIGRTGDCNDADTEALERLEQHQELGGGPAFRNHDGHIGFANEAEVAVHTLHGVKKEGRRTGRGERRSNLPRNDACLADTRDDDASRRGGDHLDGADEGVIEPVLDFGNRLGFEAQHPASALEDVRRHHRTDSDSTDRSVT